MSNIIPRRLPTLEQRICSLYKKWVRRIEADNFDSIINCRFKAVVARAEFDVILNQKDLRVSKQLLMKKEAELSKVFYMEEMSFPTSPNGVDYNRQVEYDDSILDYWHPGEKAAYPDYFAKRELRKQQYIEMWEKNCRPPPPQDV